MVVGWANGGQTVGAEAWLIPRRMRALWPSTLAVAGVVALTSFTAFLAIGTAQRTRDAYPHYLERSRVGDLVINPSFETADIDRVIRELPGVEAVTTDALFLGTSVEPSVGGGLEQFLQLRGSSDGRYTEMDQPAVSAGRLPTGQSEAFVSRSVAEAAGLHLGDTLRLGFGNARDDVDLFATGTISMAGTAKVRVVGIGTLPGEVLPDGLYPQGRVIVSPDVVHRFTCPLITPAPGESVRELVDAALPEGCSRSFLYYSLRLRDGSAGIAAAQRAFVEKAAALNEHLPHEAGAPGYFLIATTTDQERTQVERSVQPTTSALAVLGIAAVVLTLVLAALAIARDLRRHQGEIRQWWRLGMPRAQRTRVAAASIVVGTTLGVAAGLVGAWVLSPLGPVGSVRSVVPSPGRTVPSLVWVAAALLVVLLGALGVVLSFTAVRRLVGDDTDQAAAGRLSRLWRSSNRPPVGEGLRAAFGSRRAVLLVASTGLTAAMFVASTTFGTSLTGLLSSSRAYGWPWDIAMLTNAGYGGMDVARAATSLDDRPDVASWATLGFSATETLGGRSVLSIVDVAGSRSAFTVVRGRLPQGSDEVALGTRTGRDSGLDVGDTVELAGEHVDPHPVTVTGIVVLPALGPFGADRASPGLGAVLPRENLRPDALPELATFVGIQLAPSAHADDVAGWLHDSMTTWETSGGSTRQFRTPVRPPEIINARTVQSIPQLVGTIFAVATLTELGVAVALSVRSRRRELGTLRALGFTRGQLHRTVGMQAVATMAAALAVGVPFGLVLGRQTWRAFAGRLGVLTAPSTSLLALVAVVVVALAVAWIVSVPGQALATGNPTALRRE